jgi:hypothetical protein
MSLVHRAGTALVSTALAVTLVASGATAEAASPTSPAGHGAAWLVGQLNSNGLIHNRQFHVNDYGLTADTALGLDAIGGHAHVTREIRKALALHVDDYTTGVDFGSPTDRYAGAIAKLLVVAQDTGARARHFGGVNLVKRLAARVSTSAPTRGRIEDKSSFGDSANVIGQIFAVRGLLRTHSPLAKSALRFLLEQQCGQGFFRLDFNSHKAAANQGCTQKSPADTDVTALAVIQLWRFRPQSGALVKSLDVASQWLQRHQADNGSFGGSGPTSAANSNSTGLAGWALGVAGRCVAARQAATWVAQHQVTGDVSGTPLAGQRGAIAYNHAAMKAAKTDGITTTTRDQWRRATSQAAPALTYLSAKACG